MITTNQKNNIKLQLHKKAENKLKKIALQNRIKISNEIQYELEVHKIELQVQNEELLTTQLQLVNIVEEYSNLFNYAPIGYFLLDKEGRITNVNIKGASQLGFSNKELIGKHLSVFLNKKSHQDDFYKHRQSVLETRETEKIECEFKRKDNTTFFALVKSNLVRDEHKNFKHFLTIVSDITDKKEVQVNLEAALTKEKELSDLKSRFITIASHEFRTPLASIVLSADLLEKYYYAHDKDEEKRKKHYNTIKSSANRLKDILIDFLSLEEVEMGKINNRPEVFNVVNYMDTFLMEVKIYNETHLIKYEHIGKFEDIYLDKKLLNTCLTNLFINAFKYSPKGTLIELTTEQKKSGHFLITLKDNGIGIPENDMSHIFKPFFRAKNVENIEGTGLGLEITQKIIDHMGGSISFDSKENQGTTFFLKFNYN